MRLAKSRIVGGLGVLAVGMWLAANSSMVNAAGAIGISGAAGVPIGRQDELCAREGAEKVRGRL